MKCVFSTKSQLSPYLLQIHRLDPAPHLMNQEISRHFKTLSKSFKVLEF